MAGMNATRFQEPDMHRQAPAKETATLPADAAGHQDPQRLLALAKQVEASRLAQAIAGYRAAQTS